VIDPYASEQPAEFFAVLSEAFFTLPQAVRSTYPELYRQLSLFYCQDPAARRRAPI
jgi:MtfA peptidase